MNGINLSVMSFQYSKLNVLALNLSSRLNQNSSYFPFAAQDWQ